MTAHTWLDPKTGFSEIAPCSFFNRLLTRLDTFFSCFHGTPLPLIIDPYRQHRLRAVVALLRFQYPPSMLSAG